jgi:hypothetical protein
MSYLDYQRGLRDGISIGFDAGLKTGFKLGYSCGYLKGYDDGYNDSSSCLPYNPIKGLNNFKNNNVFPTLKENYYLVKYIEPEPICPIIKDNPILDKHHIIPDPILPKTNLFQEKKIDFNLNNNTYFENKKW